MSETPAARQRYKGPLTITDVADEAPVSKAGPDLSQFADVLRRSQEKKAIGHAAPAIGMTIPTGAVTTVKSRFNQAAKMLGCGVAIQVTDNGNDTSRLVVEARERKNTGPKGPRKPKAEADTNGKPAEAVAHEPVTAPVKGRGLPKVNR